MFLLARLKMYLWIAGAALVAVITIYFKGRSDGRDAYEYKAKDKRLDDLMTAKKVRDEIEILDDTGLADRASKWVRKPDGE